MSAQNVSVRIRLELITATVYWWNTLKGLLLILYALTPERKYIWISNSFRDFGSLSLSCSLSFFLRLSPCAFQKTKLTFSMQYFHCRKGSGNEIYSRYSTLTNFHNENEENIIDKLWIKCSSRSTSLLVISQKPAFANRETRGSIRQTICLLKRTIQEKNKNIEIENERMRGRWIFNIFVLFVGGIKTHDVLKLPP